MPKFSTEDLAAADVIDALDGRFSHRSHINGLVGPPKNKAIIGPALTISVSYTHLTLPTICSV